MKKSGQFYLIGAIVIISMIIGFVVITNYSKTTGYTKIYDLAEEIEIEGAQVLDYGIYNEDIGIDQMKSLLEGFVEVYPGEIDELYFIFGNAEEIVVMGYQQLNETVLIDVGIDEEAYNPLEITKKNVAHRQFPKNTKGIEKVTIIIGGVPYNFDLEDGENFYFILVQTIDGEEYIITN